MQLRPAQEKILEYDGGLMAISAVPGSGKTFTLALLAAQIIAGGGIAAPQGQQVLVVTYMNAGADNVRHRIRERLGALGLPPAGFDVRTLHSLGLEIVRLASGGDGRLSVGVPQELMVLDDPQSNLFLNRAIDNWHQANPDLWRELGPGDDPNQQNWWRRTVERTARAFIRTAKNERYRPELIARQLARQGTPDDWNDRPDEERSALWLLTLFSGIYDQYQAILARQGALDFDDLIWEAADLLENRPDVAYALSQRWPYVLEDEAQDSVPLQEVLLSHLTSQSNNWVRVGDPNQAITSTFTAAHPRYFNAFNDRADVRSLPLPNSGRCAPKIFAAANTILDWVMDEHPVPEVRTNTFRRQHIEPTPPGDAQPNPPDREADIRIKVFGHQEDEELPRIAYLARRYREKFPERTLAILVPTNSLGHRLAGLLEEAGEDYDNLLRGGTRERRIAGALHALLALLADPLSRRALVGAHDALHALGHPAALLDSPEVGAGPASAADLNRFHAILRSIQNLEAALFPLNPDDRWAALPAGVATQADRAGLDRFADFLQRIFNLRPLPIDDLALALGDELFARGRGLDNSSGGQGSEQFDLALAYQIAGILRRWRDAQPDWRLPELALQLADVAAGRRNLPLTDPGDLGYEPQPGRISLVTQHSAKGLEWDAVFLVGVDARWLPGSLDSYFQGTDHKLGINLEAYTLAQMRALMQGDDGSYPERTATESANIDVISERLRLLYVAITRARRYLHISRSRAHRSGRQEQSSRPATVMSVLYEYLQAQKGDRAG